MCENIQRKYIAFFVLLFRFVSTEQFMYRLLVGGINGWYGTLKLIAQRKKKMYLQLGGRVLLKIIAADTGLCIRLLL